MTTILMANLAFSALVCIAAVVDALTLRIPHAIPIGIVILCLACVLVGDVNVGPHVGAGILAFGVAYALFLLGALAGGDGKLCAAAALFIGMGQPLAVFVYTTAFVGGGLALLLRLVRYAPLPAHALRIDWLARAALGEQELELPYGVAIACGALAAVWISGDLS